MKIRSHIPLRILTVLESPSWADYHLAGSLEESGHVVHRFSYGKYVGEFYGRARREERLQKNRELLAMAEGLLQGDGLDLIFCYVYDDFLLPEYAKALSSLGAPMVNLNVDMVSQWYRQIGTARYFTRILCAHRENMENMAKYGANVMYFPMAARIAAYPDEDEEWVPAAPVTFVGTPMPYRAAVIGRLHAEGVSVAVYGKYWQEQRQALPMRNIEKTLADLRHYGLARMRGEGVGALLRALTDRLPRSRLRTLPGQKAVLPASVLHGFVPDEVMPALFRRSRINLGFTRMVGEDPDQVGINQVKLRDFEVPMAGGFYLVEKAPDYEGLFKPGVEVETWQDMTELREKIHYYLTHDCEREAIAAAGAKRARAEHSWEIRFRNLFTELGLVG